jgi:GNAT superfamily N-acetyltransferase
MKITCDPLTPDRWPDVESLFGERGACAGCWCMWWRLPRKQWTAQKGAKNKKAFKALVNERCPGILAYDGDKTVGWLAVEPRAHYPALERSRILKPVDDKEVWSITCFFIHKDYRRQGISKHLLEYAKKYCKGQGAKTLEGYPHSPKKDKMPDAFAWTGIEQSFIKAGFKEVARRSETRPVMRVELR